jgi:hypothetical protein
MSEYRDWLFRGLKEEQINDMRQWAWDNYKPGDAVKSYWHPVVRRECERIERGGNAKNAAEDKPGRPTTS